MIIEIIGYIAMLLLVIGVYLIRKKKYAFQCDILLTLGQIGIVINSFYFGALPAAIANAVATVFSLLNIREDLKEREKTQIIRKIRMAIWRWRLERRIKKRMKKRHSK